MRCATASRPICSNAAPISESSRRAHEQRAEARITYRFHPRFGEVVQIRRRLGSGGFEFVVVLQPDGSFASLPAWMTEPAASRLRQYGLADRAKQLGWTTVEIMMTISEDRAAASLVQALSDCWPQFVTVVSVRCLRSKLRVSPATAATGTHSSSSVDWSAPSSSTRTESTILAIPTIGCCSG